MDFCRAMRGSNFFFFNHSGCCAKTRVCVGTRHGWKAGDQVGEGCNNLEAGTLAWPWIEMVEVAREGQTLVVL